MRIDRVMTPRPLCVWGDQTLEKCARTFRDNRISHLVAVHPDGRLAGVVGAREVLAHGRLTLEDEWRAEDGSEDVVVADVTREASLLAQPEDPVHIVLRALVAGEDDIVVVVDESQRPLGVLTAHDGVRLAASSLPDAEPSGPHLTSPVLGVGLRDRVVTALKRMQDHSVRHLVVRDRFDKLRGMLSSADLVERGIDEQSVLLVVDVIRPGVAMLDDGMSLKAVAAEMEQRRQGCALVGTTPPSIITRTDILRALVRYIS